MSKNELNEELKGGFEAAHVLITESFFADYVEPMQKLLASMTPAGEVRFRPSRSASVEDYEWADAWVGFTPPAPPSETGIRWYHSGMDGVNQYAKYAQDFEDAGALLTHTVGTMPHRIAEFTVAAVLAEIVGLPRYRDSQRSHEYDRHVNPSALGSKVTVIGTGNIGSEIANKLRPWVESVRGLSLSGRAREAFDEVATLSEARETGRFLSDADVIVLILPDTPETQNVVDGEVLKWIGRSASTKGEAGTANPLADPRYPGAILVNVGRGSTLDSEALHAALDSGALAHAVIDVFETEPLPAADWRWEHSRVTLTPHVSGFTWASDILTDFEQSWRELARGERPSLAVDLTKGY